MNFYWTGADVKWEKDQVKVTTNKTDKSIQMPRTQPFVFDLELSNIITEVRVAPACKAYVRSGESLILSDPNCIVWGWKWPGKWGSKLEEGIR